jgi:acyl-CoA thioesterase YciA
VSDSQLPQDRMPVLRLPATPKDVNPAGSMFGGWIMSCVDIAGSIPAEMRARGPIVTRAVEAFEFKKPVLVGDIISLYADIVSVGRSSIKVDVTVYAQRIRKGVISTIKVTEAVVIYVAIDEQGRPRMLPKE